MHSIYMSPIPKAMSPFHTPNLVPNPQPQTIQSLHSLDVYAHVSTRDIYLRNTNSNIAYQHLYMREFETHQVRMLVQWDSVNFKSSLIGSLIRHQHRQRLVS